MTDEQLGPLDPELDSLLDAERAAMPASAAIDRVWSRVAVAALPVPGGGGSPAAAPGAGAGAGWLASHTVGVAAATFVVGGLAGAGLHAVIEKPPPARIVYVERQAPPATSVASPPAVSAPVLPAVPSAIASPTPVAASEIGTRASAAEYCALISSRPRCALPGGDTEQSLLAGHRLEPPVDSVTKGPGSDQTLGMKRFLGMAAPTGLVLALVGCKGNTADLGGERAEGGTIRLDAGTESDAIEERPILDAVTEEAEAPLCPLGEANCGAVLDCLKTLLESAFNGPPDGSLPDGVFAFSREADLIGYMETVLQLDASAFTFAGQTLVGASGHPYVDGYLPSRNLFFVIDGYYAPTAYQLGVQYDQCAAADASAD